MMKVTRVVDWATERPMVWRGALAVVALILALLIALGPLPALMGTVAIAGLLVIAGLLIVSLSDRLPLELCFLAFVALMPATRFSLFETGVSVQANFIMLMAVAGLLAWRAGMLKLPLWFPRSRVNGAVLALFLVIALSFFLSIQVSPGVYRGEVRYLRSAKQIIYFIFMIVTYVTVLLAVQNRRMFRWVIWVFIGASFTVSLYGLYQFTAYPLGLPFVDLFPQSASFGESRVWAIPLAGGRFLRIWSVASEPVWFGDYLAGVIPLTASLAFSNVAPRGWARWMLWLALAAMLVALLLTFTRSAYMALFVGVLVLLLFRPKLLVRGTAAGAVLVIVLVLVGLLASQMLFAEQASLVDAVADRLLSPFQEEHFGNIHRTSAIAASWAMFRDRPWGVGYGNYGFFYYDYRPLWGRATTDYLVNAFPVMSGGILFRLLTETSIPGVLAFIWMVLAVMLEGINAQRRLAGDRFMDAAIIGLLAGFLTLMARIQMADSIHFTYQWFFIAMIVAARRMAREETDIRSGGVA